MSRIYTAIGSGSYAARHRAVEAEQAMLETDLGRVRAGTFPQIVMGWSNDADIFRKTAEEILEHMPYHAWQTNPKNHDMRIGDDLVDTPAFPHVAKTTIEKEDPSDIAGMVINYEAFKTAGKPRFELGWRPCTHAEIELMAGCYATAKSIAFKHTGRGVPISCWNLPFKPLDDRNDWDSIVEAHRAMGSQFVVLNAYHFSGPAKQQYVEVRAAIELYRDEFAKRGYPIPVVVALSLSTGSHSFDPIDMDDLIMKAMAAKGSKADAMMWLNSDWYVGNNKAKIDERFHALGGVFKEEG